MALPMHERTVRERRASTIAVLIDVMNLGLVPPHITAAADRSAAFLIAVVDQFPIEEAKCSLGVLWLELQILAHDAGEKLVAALNRLGAVTVDARPDAIP